jgi:hypothetical protein
VTIVPLVMSVRIVGRPSELDEPSRVASGRAPS